MRLSVVLLAVLCVAACAEMPRPGGKPVPQPTFDHLQPVELNVSAVNVERTFREDPLDVSGRFIASPADALESYVRHRFRAGGGDNALDVVIDDARVHYREIEQRNKALRWAGVGKEDEYRVMVVLKVLERRPMSAGEGHGLALRFDRTLILPQNISLAEREMRQVKFLEELAAEIDTSVLRALDQTMGLVRHF